MEQESDVFMHCEKPECEGEPELITVRHNDESDICTWTCPRCKTKYEFNIEYQPEVINMVESE